MGKPLKTVFGTVRNYRDKKGGATEQDDQIGMHYARGPSSKTQDPLDTYQRFDLSGHDYKGQISSGCGQVGVGGSLSVSADPGTFIAPGIVKIPVSVTVGGSRSNHTFIAMTRFPIIVFDKRYKTSDEVRAANRDPDAPKPTGRLHRNPPTAAWTTTRPLIMMTLSGLRWEGSVSGSIGAGAGIGDPEGADEVSLTVGAGVAFSADAVVSATMLIDERPRSYRSAYPAAGSASSFEEVDNLAAYINNALESDVKLRTVLWMAERGGTPEISAAARTLSRGTTALDWASDRWAEAQHHPEWDGKAGGGLKKFGGFLRTRSRPSTDELVDRLDDVELELKLHRSLTRSQGDWTTHLETVYLSDLDMVAKLKRTLRQRYARKQLGLPQGGVSRSPAPHPAPRAGGAIGLLHIGSRIYRGQGSAAFTIKLGYGGTARFKKTVEAKHIGFRFQAVNVPAGGTAPLVYSQHTSMTQKLYMVDEFVGMTDLKRERQPRHYGTVSYRSACAYWLDTHGSNVTALLNGSGVSLGLSVQASRLDAYATAIAQGQTELDSELVTFEQLLMSTMNVPSWALRRFVGAYPFVGAISEVNDLKDTSVTIEAGFALLRPVPLTIDPDRKHREPSKLLEQEWARERLVTSMKEAYATELSVLRIRYRIRRAEDNSYPLLSFGWAHATSQFSSGGKILTPLKAFPPPISATPRVTRIEQVGSEGLVDLHVMFFPESQSTAARLLQEGEVDKRAESTSDYELAVPAVALFSQ